MHVWVFPEVFPWLSLFVFGESRKSTQARHIFCFSEIECCLLIPSSYSERLAFVNLWNVDVLTLFLVAHLQISHYYGMDDSVSFRNPHLFFLLVSFLGGGRGGGLESWIRRQCCVSCFRCLRREKTSRGFSTRLGLWKGHVGLGPVFEVFLC